MKDDDVLFLACTRPVMIGGVTMQVFLLNGFILAMILTINIFYTPICVVIHLICRFICKYDHNAFRIIAGWVNTRFRCRTIPYWGGSTVSPLPVHAKTRERALAD